jgi:hypothetical protein
MNSGGGSVFNPERVTKRQIEKWFGLWSSRLDYISVPREIFGAVAGFMSSSAACSKEWSHV